MLPPDQQMEAYQKRLEEHPASLVFLPLAELFQRHGRLVDAIDVCRKGLHYHASLSKAKLLLGELLFHQGQMVEAGQWFRSVLIDYPNHDMATQFLSRISQQGAVDMPRPLPMVSSIPTFPLSTPATTNSPLPVEEFQTPTMAELYVRQGLVSEAITLYQTIVQTQPNNTAAKNRLAELEGKRVGEGGMLSKEEIQRRLEIVKETILKLSSEVQFLEKNLK